MGPMGCSETSVSYQYSLRNDPEERGSHIQGKLVMKDAATAL